MKIFFGSDLTDADYDRIALLRIDPELRKEEPALFDTKWFDYRREHPTKMTYLFAHEYVQAVKDIHSKTSDVHEAKTLKVLDHEDIFIPNDSMAIDVSFWKARQAADAQGVPYDFYLNFAMNRAANRGWHVYPRPNQLYMYELVLDAGDAWRQQVSEIFTTSKSPIMRTEHFEGHPDQAAYQRWLLDRCAERPMPEAPLSRCFREGHLTPEIAASRFSDKVIQEAIRLST
jgi:hypothetical protein